MTRKTILALLRAVVTCFLWLGGFVLGNVIFRITPEPWRIPVTIIATVILIAYMTLLNLEHDEKKEDEV